MDMLRITNLKKHFGDKEVLTGLNLSVPEHSVFGFVGENGAGKTTTMKTVMGVLGKDLIHVPDGKMDFAGKNVLEMKQSELLQLRRTGISMISQSPMSALNPVFTIGQQLIKAVEKNQNLRGKEAYEKALEMISLVKLPDAENVLQKYPHELSGGQRQRIIIAIALSCGAEFLIADEPTRNLDVTIQAGILKLLAELQK